MLSPGEGGNDFPPRERPRRAEFGAKLVPKKGAFSGILAYYRASSRKHTKSPRTLYLCGFAGF